MPADAEDDKRSLPENTPLAAFVLPSIGEDEHAAGVELDQVGEVSCLGIALGEPKSISTIELAYWGIF